jgi:hypothetical protein
MLALPTVLLFVASAALPDSVVWSVQIKDHPKPSFITMRMQCEGSECTVFRNLIYDCQFDAAAHLYAFRATVSEIAKDRFRVIVPVANGTETHVFTHNDSMGLWVSDYQGGATVTSMIAKDGDLHNMTYLPVTGGGLYPWIQLNDTGTTDTCRIRVPGVLPPGWGKGAKASGSKGEPGGRSPSPVTSP